MKADRQIPALDGLRALAVLSVIFFHCDTPVLESDWLLPLRNGGIGVTGFFVISGFLITRLLLRELTGTGRLDLARFYFRRGLRIFPAFYTFLAVAALAGLAGFVSVETPALLSAATYTWNYSPVARGWIFSHTWSLSLEEQFYLLWPLCLFFFRPSTCLWIAVGAVAASPFSRVATYFLLPGVRESIHLMSHTRLDGIMLGCAISLSQHLGRFNPALRLLAHPASAVAALVYLAVQPFLLKAFRGSFALPVGMSLDAFACASLLLCAVANSDRPAVRWLNATPVAHVGKISYSLYLWQQLFTGPYTRAFPLNIVAIFLCAEASYWFVEQPALRLRDRFFTAVAPLATRS